MEVIVAKSAGFCFGVERAVETVYEQIEKGGAIYTYGPIIHNEEVVNDLAKKGVRVIEDADELAQLKEGTVVIRSHGVERSTYEKIKQQGLGCVDATCPFVKKIHRIVEEKSREGYQIVIIGDKEHPEVKGICGWAHEAPVVIESAQEAENFLPNCKKKLCVVAQTTFNYNKFQELVAFFEKKGYDLDVVNTICNATEVRQTEARNIASRVDTMIVIGGANSSNTKKLYEICKKECENTYFIQTLEDLKLEISKSSARLVGITAGASTPKEIIEEVQNYVRIIF
jgi:4-hydroxy-3-methylbut-2-enyl diphosphate reductase